MAHIIIGVILILFGLSAIFGGWVFRLVFAALLIALGVKIIMGPRETNQCHWRCRTSHLEDSPADVLNETVVLGSLCKNVTSTKFEGGKITTVLGGGILDLRNAKTDEKKIELEIVAVLGGLKIFVPTNWIVKVQNSSVLGGCENRTHVQDGDVTLIISGTSVLGGISIVNG